MTHLATFAMIGFLLGALFGAIRAHGGQCDMPCQETVPVSAQVDGMLSTEWGCDDLDDDCQHLTAAPLEPMDMVSPEEAAAQTQADMAHWAAGREPAGGGE